MVLPAMVYKSDVRETLAHFRAIAAATGLPIMIYNNPVSYGVDVPPEAFARLADVANIVAIKESSENVRRITDLVNLTGDRYILFAGVDDLALESVAAGRRRAGCPAWSTRFPRRIMRSGKWPRAATGDRRANCTAGTCRCCTWTPG